VDKFPNERRITAFAARFALRKPQNVIWKHTKKW
ncbi:unnamed protein product, partial [marine sediment metagenome]